MKRSNKPKTDVSDSDDLISYLMFHSRSLAAQFIGTIPAPLEVLIPLTAGVLSPAWRPVKEQAENDDRPCDQHGDFP